MSQARSLQTCIQCGQTDDHPKAHWLSGETYHHDCLPFAKRQEVIDSSQHGKAIIEAAEGGKRGNDLLAHIEDLHKGA